MDIHAGYYELGLDSPSLLEMVQAIGSQIGEELSPTLLFEYTTIAELSAYLAENYSIGEADDAVRRSPAPKPESLDAVPSASKKRRTLRLLGWQAVILRRKTYNNFGKI